MKVRNFCNIVIVIFGFSESLIRYFLAQIFGTSKPSYIAGDKFTHDVNEYLLRKLWCYTCIAHNWILWTLLIFISYTQEEHMQLLFKSF